MRQLVMMAMVSVAVLLFPFDVNAQTEEMNQDSCSAVCEAELEECANRPGSLFSRTQAQIDVANECYGKCSREEGDGLEACQVEALVGKTPSESDLAVQKEIRDLAIGSKMEAGSEQIKGNLHFGQKSFVIATGRC